MSQTPVIIAVSVVWLAIGSAIGGYLFPDQVTVEKRVEVPVEVLKYVDRPVEIIKEVVKIKEVEKHLQYSAEGVGPSSQPLRGRLRQGAMA